MPRSIFGSRTPETGDEQLLQQTEVSSKETQESATSPPTTRVTIDEGTEDPEAQGDPTQQSCAKKMTRRTKCAICLAVIVLMLVTGGILGVFVVGPNIAKASLDASTISFTKLTMSNPTDSSFTTQAELTIAKVAPFGCSIGAMELQVMYNDVEVGKLQMPKMDVAAYTQNHKSVEASTFHVTNVETWNSFSKAMIRKDTVTWRLKSKADITALGVTFRGIDFDKEIPLSCFNGLDDVQMDVFDMSGSTKDELVVAMTVCMRNPSDIAIMNLGDVFFGIHYEDAYMGNVTAHSSAVSVTRSDESNGDCSRFDKHGYNSLKMTGTLQPSNHEVADKLMSRYLSNRSSIVYAKALSPADSLPLFNEGMQGLNLKTTLNGNPEPLIVGLDMLSASMIPVDNNDVTMQMLAQVHVDSPLGDHSSMSIHQVAMGVKMLYAGNVVGTITTPLSPVHAPNTINGKGSVNVSVSSAGMSLPDQGDALATLAKDLINKDTLTISLDGHSNCSAMSEALKYDMNVTGVPVKLPNLDAKPPLGAVTVTGMNGLPDVSIVDYSIPGIVPDHTDGCETLCGVQITTTVKLMNPSPFGLRVGTLNSQVRTMDDVILGNVSANDLTLNPGENVIKMSGKLFATTDTLPAASEFFSNYLKKQAQKTKVVGIDAGDSKSKWLHEAIRSMSLTVEFPGADDFNVLTDIEVKTMKMSFQEGDHPPTLSGTIRAKMNMPKPVSMSIIKEVKSSAIQFEMIDVDSGKSFGSLTVQSDAEYDSKDGTITASFAESDVKVTDTDSFSNVIKDLLLSEKKQVRMRGLLSPKVLINIGELQFQDIPFEGETILYGFNKFMSGDKPLMSIPDQLEIVGAKDGVVDLEANADVVNPSNLAVSMGRVVLELWLGENKISEMTVEDFALDAGPDKKTSFKGVKATYAVQEAGKPGREFLSNFAVGQDQKVSIRGAKDGSGTSISLLKPALAALVTQTVVPGLSASKVPGLKAPPNRLLQSSVMHPPYSVIIHPTQWGNIDIPTNLVVQNPFKIPITFLTSYCDVTACESYVNKDKCKQDGYFDSPVGYYTPDKINEVVKGQGIKELQKHSVHTYKTLTKATIETLAKALTGGALIKLKGNMTLGLGENTVVAVDYSEIDVPVAMSLVSSEATVV